MAANRIGGALLAPSRDDETSGQGSHDRWSSLLAARDAGPGGDWAPGLPSAPGSHGRGRWKKAPGAEDATFEIDEDAAGGAVVGTVSATDPDKKDVLTYEIVDGDPDGVFTIDSRTGEIRLADGTSLDYETAASYTLTVRVTDRKGLTDEATITIEVGDVEEAAPPPVLYFVGSDAEHGTELWAWNGTELNLVADVAPGTAGSGPVVLATVGDGVFFSADDGVYFSDATTGETRRLADTVEHPRFDSVSIGNGAGYFSTENAAGERSFWRYEWATDTLEEIDLPPPGEATGSESLEYYLDVDISHALGDDLLLIGTNDDQFRTSDFWLYDGETGEVERLTDYGLTNLADITYTLQIGDDILFNAWATGPERLLRLDVETGQFRHIGEPGYHSNFTTSGDDLYFTVFEDGSQLNALWTYDSATNTEKELVSFTEFGGFTGVGDYAVVGNDVLFTREAFDPDNDVSGLWRRDGDTGGFELLTDGVAELEGTHLGNLAAVDDQLYFTVRERSELWRYDDETGEFAEILDLPGTSAFGSGVLVADGDLYFNREVGGVNELWAFDTDSSSLTRVTDRVQVADGGQIVPADDYPLIA